MEKHVNGELYSEMLSLGPDWTVGEVLICHKEKTVNVEILYREGALAVCPKCGGRCGIYDHAPERRWRHLDTMQYETFLRSKVPRANCPECGIQTMKTPWSEPGTRYTLMFEAHAVAVIEGARSLVQACELLGIGWSRANTIMKRAVARGLERRKLEELPRAGIDEKSFRKRHSYVTTLNDLDNGRVIEVVEGRKEADADRLWEGIGEDVRQTVQAVAMDMWPAFENATVRAVPGVAIVHDRFHISKHLNGGVNKVRSEEHRKMMSQGDDRLKGTRNIWLWNEENLSDKQYASFKEVKDAELKTSRAWLIKESFRFFWDLPKDEKAAREYFKDWYRHTIYSKLEPMKKVARMIKEHLENIVTWWKHRITNAVSEGLNSKIQSIKSAARGFHSFGSYRTRILFFCGGLDMKPNIIH
jgi:transposase